MIIGLWFWTVERNTREITYFERGKHQYTEVMIPLNLARLYNGEDNCVHDAM